VHAQRGQFLDLGRRQDAERGRDVDLHFGPDGPHAFAHLGHEALVRTAHRGHDAELGRPGRRGLPGRLDEHRDVQPHRPHRRGEQARLGTEVAVLRAAAGLQRDDALDLNLGPAPAGPHLVGELERLGHILVGQAEHLEDAGGVEADTVGEDLRTGAIKHGGHGRTLMPAG
jgi:hypothetical protein